MTSADRLSGISQYTENYLEPLDHKELLKFAERVFYDMKNSPDFHYAIETLIDNEMPEYINANNFNDEELNTISTYMRNMIIDALDK